MSPDDPMSTDGSEMLDFCFRSSFAPNGRRGSHFFIKCLVALTSEIAKVVVVHDTYVVDSVERRS